jgi:hypothetical protein
MSIPFAPAPPVPAPPSPSFALAVTDRVVAINPQDGQPVLWTPGFAVDNEGNVYAAGLYVDNDGAWSEVNANPVIPGADGTYSTITTDANGEITGAGQISGDITTAAGVATLPTVNSNVGTFQGLTVNAKGQVTAAATQTRAKSSGSYSPTGTTSTAGVMMGLGSTFELTPEVSGNVLITICGAVNCQVEASVFLYYGTGTAPANGHALTGTLLGGVSASINATVAQVPFSLTALVSGSALGTKIWMDLALATTNGSDEATVTQVTASAVEI